MSYRDGPCRCGAGTYRVPRYLFGDRRSPRRCEDCHYIKGLCRCVVRLTVHMCPPGDSGIMPCCGRTPFETREDRITLDPRRVTCRPHQHGPWIRDPVHGSSDAFCQGCGEAWDRA